MLFPKLAAIFLSLTLIGDSCAKFLIDERDWSNSNATVILSYHYRSLQSDYFAHALCEGNDGDKTRVCHAQMEFPRFSGIVQVCHTTLGSAGDEGKLNLPHNLIVIGDRIIFPWVTGKNDRDVLTVRVINMKTCHEKNLILDVEKQSYYKIIPFSDTYDIFYEPIQTKDVEFKRYRKVSFNVNSRGGDIPEPFFSHIPQDDIKHHQGRPFYLLDQILPISSTDSSKGYFFLPQNGNEIRALDSKGLLQGWTKVPFPIYPFECSYGLDGILISEYVDQNSRHFQQYNATLDIKLESNYTVREGQTLAEYVSIGIDEVLILTCDDMKNDLKAPPPTNCYLERIHKNDRRGKLLQIPQIRIEDSTQIYLSSVNEHICVNAVTYGLGYPQKLQTLCTERSSLD